MGGGFEISPELTIVYPVQIRPQAPWRNKLQSRKKEEPAPAGRLPRIARLMALAIRFDQLRRTGCVADYATLARLGHVSRARITQVMNLLHLAPDIQEELLFLPRVERGKNPLHLRHLQPIAAVTAWPQQRLRWRLLRAEIDQRAASQAAQRSAQ